MFKKIMVLFFATGAVLTALPAHALLVGDTVQLGHYFDDQLSPYGENPGFRTVQAGDADSWSYVGLYKVNPEDTGFFVDFDATGTWSSGSAFNGLKISGIDEPVSSVNVDTNLDGWDNSRLATSNGEIDLNWSGLSWKDDTYFNAHVSAVPEPSTLFLLGGGLIGAALRRKMRS